MQKPAKGMALILFGILLCCAEEGINSFILYSFSGFPFSLVGLVLGCVGLFLVFKGPRDQ
ncbi:MAG: hypothetical protein LUG57_11060 [Oscillospiraceae bacterium]|nr:hypothetical protein [Oscillospiraceae bacterium]